MKLSRIIFSHHIVTAQGECVLLATECGVCWIGTPGRSIDEGLSHMKRWTSIDSVVCGKENKIIQQATEQLERYFAGEHVDFSFTLDLFGTPFQQAVWQHLTTIAYGTTTTYGAVARALNCPRGSRAVGGAVGSNPISIVLPCHRVIGSSGKLTGYAGGLAIKTCLLDLEIKK
jgi:O-6-methylguanine DNA methyltransferase